MNGQSPLEQMGMAMLDDLEKSLDVLAENAPLGKEAEGRQKVADAKAEIARLREHPPIAET